MMNDIKHLVCSARACRILKPVSEFPKNKSTPTGFGNQCKVCKSLVNKNYKFKNKNKIKIYADIYNKIYYWRNPEKHRERRRKNIKEYPEVDAAWRRANSGKVNAFSAAYRAAKLQATPKWLTDHHKTLMKMFYDRSSYLTEITGFKWHVDHIIPLQGKNVRGLHVPWNLRVIPGPENLSKNNRI